MSTASTTQALTATGKVIYLYNMQETTFIEMCIEKKEALQIIDDKMHNCDYRSSDYLKLDNEYCKLKDQLYMLEKELQEIIRRNNNIFNRQYSVSLHPTGCKVDLYPKAVINKETINPNGNNQSKQTAVS